MNFITKKSVKKYFNDQGIQIQDAAIVRLDNLIGEFLKRTIGTVQADRRKRVTPNDISRTFRSDLNYEER